MSSAARRPAVAVLRSSGGCVAGGNRRPAHRLELREVALRGGAADAEARRDVGCRTAPSLDARRTSTASMGGGNGCRPLCLRPADRDDAVHSGSRAWPSERPPGRRGRPRFSRLRAGDGPAGVEPASVHRVHRVPTVSGGSPGGLAYRRYLSDYAAVWHTRQILSSSYNRYDSVVIAALAMTAAHSTDPSVWGKDVIKVSNPPGTKCCTYAGCVVLVEAGKKINYEGATGPEDFNQYHSTFSGFAASGFTSTNQLVQRGYVTAQQVSSGRDRAGSRWAGPDRRPGWSHRSSERAAAKLSEEAGGGPAPPARPPDEREALRERCAPEGVERVPSGGPATAGHTGGGTGQVQEVSEASSSPVARRRASASPRSPVLLRGAPVRPRRMCRWSLPRVPVDARRWPSRPADGRRIELGPTEGGDHAPP